MLLRPRGSVRRRDAEAQNKLYCSLIRTIMLIAIVADTLTQAYPSI